MTAEIIRNYGSRVALLNEKKDSSFSDSEIAALALLNAKLNLKLDPTKQQSIEGLKLILSEIINQKWKIHDLHSLGISLRSLGVICLKLRGLYHFPYDPFGRFGINKEKFIDQN